MNELILFLLLAAGLVALNWDFLFTKKDVQ